MATLWQPDPCSTVCRDAPASHDGNTKDDSTVHRKEDPGAGSPASALSASAGRQPLEPWERADLAIDALVGTEDDVWAARPVIAGKRRGRLQEAGDGSLPRVHQVPGEDIARRPGAPRRLRLGLSISESGAVGIWTTANQRRALPDLATNEMTDFSVKDYLGVRQSASLVERCHEVCRSAYEAVGQTFDGEFLLVRKQVLAAATASALLMRILDYCDCTSVVVATQHATPPRAGIIAARRLGLPSVYVPHAPFALNRLYADLPADWAGLWGGAERDMYASLGADVDRISVVGTAMHDLGRDVMTEVGSPRRHGLPLVAPSAWPDEQLAYFLEECSAALSGSFAVAPHPRNSIDVVRDFTPKRAILLEGISANHLTSAEIVIQCNSGIALEGLLAGVPVLNFDPFGMRSNYPLIREPYVPQCTTRDDVQRRLNETMRNPDSLVARDRREWARSWCAYSGREARDRLHELLRGAKPKQNPVLDGWSTSDSESWEQP